MEHNYYFEDNENLSVSSEIEGNSNTNSHELYERPLSFVDFTHASGLNVARGNHHPESPPSDDLEELFQNYFQQRPKSNSTVHVKEPRTIKWKLKGKKTNWHHAMWFELLSDIMILVALYKMSLENRFESIEDGFRIIAKFMFIWQVWYGQVILMSQFDTDYMLFKFFQLVQVLAIMTIGITRPYANTNFDAYFTFVSTILLSKVILLFQILVTLLSHGKRAILKHSFWILSILIELILWGLTLKYLTVTDNDYNEIIWLWRIGVMLEFLGSLYSGSQSNTRECLFLQDRCRLLTVAMFGKLWFGITIFLNDFSYPALLMVILHTILIFCFWRIYYFSTKISDMNCTDLSKIFWLFCHFVFHLLLFIGTSAAYDILQGQITSEMKLELYALCLALTVLAALNSLDNDPLKGIPFIVCRVLCSFGSMIIIISINISNFGEYLAALTILTSMVLLLMIVEWFINRYLADKVKDQTQDSINN
eukprot:NODE_63_length_26141_cov_1.022656.p6 type:complete len:479 gc:universal NODE_63_length_26141_cov_1.022656:4976-3540(-)